MIHKTWLCFQKIKFKYKLRPRKTCFRAVQFKGLIFNSPPLNTFDSVKVEDWTMVNLSRSWNKCNTFFVMDNLKDLFSNLKDLFNNLKTTSTCPLVSSLILCLLGFILSRDLFKTLQKWINPSKNTGHPKLRHDLYLGWKV